MKFTRVLALLLTVTMLFTGMVLPTVAEDGEEEEEYTPIYTIEDLYCIRYDLDGNFKLMNDIDMTADVAEGGDWDAGYGWDPIGAGESTAFTGTFDGQGYTITGLRIADPVSGNTGLFGYLNGGTVKDFTLDTVDIESARQYVGAAVGYCKNSSTVSGITVTNASLSANSEYAGGIVGCAESSSVSDCHYTGSVINARTFSATGGVLGRLNGSKSVHGRIDSCSFNGTVSGGQSVGGIVGYMGIYTDASQCYASGSVVGTADVGGIVGYAGGHTLNDSSASVSISKCYNLADVSSNVNGGGIAGVVYANGYFSVTGHGGNYGYEYWSYYATINVLDCYSIGVVQSGQQAGAIVGKKYINTSSYNWITISSCYYLKDTADTGVYGTADTATTCVALTAAQSRLKAVYGYFDFENVWFFDKSTGIEHPQLRSNPETICDHIWGNEVVVTVPTCTTAGVKTLTCSVCGEVKQESISALGHTPVVVDEIPATCTEPGNTAYTYCSVCLEVLEGVNEVIPATGHTYGDGVVTTDPTCTEPGVKTYTCFCGDCYTEEIPALGHDYVPVVTPPTAEEGGYTTYTCSRCEASYVSDYTEPAGHHYDEGVVTTQPTCTETGVMTYTCTDEDCNKSYTEVIPALGHTPVVVDEIPATCAVAGNTGYTYCSVCEAILVEPEAIPALGHTEVVVDEIPASCTESGNTGYIYCSVCEEILEGENVEIPALDHTEIRVDEIPATCTESGWTYWTFCEVCGETIVPRGELPALGHDYVGIVTQPTQTEQGYTTYTCSRCEDSYVGDYVPALTGRTVTWIVEGIVVKTVTNVTTDFDPEYDGATPTKAEDANSQYYFSTWEKEVVENETVYTAKFINVSSNASHITGGKCGKNVYWSLDSNGVLLITGTGDMFDYSSQSPAPWAKTDSYYDYSAQVRKVVIQDGVTSIGNRAFAYCGNLEEIAISSGVSVVGEFAFGYCRSLTSLFIPDTVKEIKHSAFSWCTNLETITLQEGLLRIEDMVFQYNNKLGSIYIPASVTYFGRIFNCEQLEDIYVDENSLDYCSVDGILYNKNKTVIVICPSAKSGRVEILPSVNEIANYAFWKCGYIDDIFIPNGVTKIGISAFVCCSMLEEIILPNQVWYIGEYAFEDCTSLSSITIPKSVTTVGKYPFYECSNLKDIYCDVSKKPVGWSSDWTNNCSAKVHWLGDVDDSGYVSIADVSSLLLLISNQETCFAGDINKDGSISIADVTCLLGLIS